MPAYIPVDVRKLRLCKFLTAFSLQIYSNQASDLEELGLNSIY